MSEALRFPEHFLWGAATSSHQVEGNQDNDWSEWEKLGRVARGEQSGIACDHWNRFEHDFDLARTLGHNAHRFSIEWSRIEPRQGMWNEHAIDHYRTVVKAIKDRGMEPYVTLWHFTHPRWFAHAGGWLNPKAPQLFSRYVAQVARAFSDVRFWVTINEPNVYALLSYGIGYWPPQHKHALSAYRVAKHLAAGHRRAYEVIKTMHPSAQVGSAPNLVFYEPSNHASSTNRLVSRLVGTWYNHRWLDWTHMSSDFIGVNHYIHQRVRFGSVLHPVVIEPQGEPQTDTGWQIFPQAIYEVLRIAARYQKPLHITENGIADAHDTRRQEFIHNYLVNVHRAISEGIDVRAYFYWSLLDNFEWKEGFSKRFGLIEVDFATQRRTVRPSARWYAEVCRSNALAVVVA